MRIAPHMQGFTSFRGEDALSTLKVPCGQAACWDWGKTPYLGHTLIFYISSECLESRWLHGWVNKAIHPCTFTHKVGKEPIS